MKNKLMLVLIGVVIAVFGCLSMLSAGQDVYYCPMHPDFQSDKPGNCSICGMSLVKKQPQRVDKDEDSSKSKERKPKFYRNPMDPAVTSPVPMKDSMGMDYVPVFDEPAQSASGEIFIEPQRQQLIAVKKEQVQFRHLERKIMTVGKVAFDPQLYVAQQEYVQALAAYAALPVGHEAGMSLVGAAEKKLLLMGMNQRQILELAQEKKPQENLYLTTDSDTAWIYITVYEYEMGLINEGLLIEAEATGYPGEIFKGEISSIANVVDPMTRSIVARAMVDNSRHLLKPEMFVNVVIRVDLGELLSVSEESVIHTGPRNLVVVQTQANHFATKEVKLGHQADGYYEVLSGLSDGETVITSGNFLIDSESRLQSALSQTQ